MKWPSINNDKALIFEFIVRNQSKMSIILPLKPTSFEFRTAGANGGDATYFIVKSRADFVRLKPNEVLKFILPLDYAFIYRDPAADIDLEYEEDGHSYGLQAWMGKVSVQIERGNQQTPTH